MNGERVVVFIDGMKKVRAVYEHNNPFTVHQKSLS